MIHGCADTAHFDTRQALKAQHGSRTRTTAVLAGAALLAPLGAPAATGNAAATDGGRACAPGADRAAEPQQIAVAAKVPRPGMGRLADLFGPDRSERKRTGARDGSGESSSATETAPPTVTDAGPHERQFAPR